MAEEKKTSGRPPMKNELNELKDKIKNLEDCISKIAHYSGANRIIDEFGISRWEPTKNDMKKYRDS